MSFEYSSALKKKNISQIEFDGLLRTIPFVKKMVFDRKDSEKLEFRIKFDFIPEHSWNEDISLYLTSTDLSIAIHSGTKDQRERIIQLVEDFFLRIGYIICLEED
jgi:hypothetical protein